MLIVPDHRHAHQHTRPLNDRDCRTAEHLQYKVAYHNGLTPTPVVQATGNLVERANPEAYARPRSTPNMLLYAIPGNDDTRGSAIAGEQAVSAETSSHQPGTDGPEAAQSYFLPC